MRSRETRGARRGVRVARRLGKGLGYALLALLGLLLLLLACVNLPPVRAFVAARTNAALAQTFAGRLSIEHIGTIGWNGVSGVHARAFDDAGQQVVEVHGARVSMPWPQLVWDLLVRKPNPLVIRIDHVALDHADVTLRDDGSGTPTLATTFLPRHPSTGPPSAQQTVVTLADIEVDHAWVHGALGTLPPLDAEVARLAGTLHVDDSATTIDVARSELEARNLPGVGDGQGRFSGKMQIAALVGINAAEVHFRGHVAGVPVMADATLGDEQVAALIHAVAPAEALT
ncbi:MAG TPA: hypothetical protein VM686_17760, partial [Polyangiaceae bacterium]|nr:hypothetical protein [Polyangiaceae bacterium]